MRLVDQIELELLCLAKRDTAFLCSCQSKRCRRSALPPHAILGPHEALNVLGASKESRQAGDG